MTTEYLYIVGKSDLQLKAAAAIRAAGYKVGILSDTSLTLTHSDSFDRVVNVDYTKIDSELERLSTLDLHIAGLLCTYENYIVAKAKIASYFQVPTQSLESAQASTDKSLMRQAFLGADQNITPDYKTITSLQDALDFATAHGYPLIIKPTNLVKSLLVLTCHDRQQLIDNYTHAIGVIDALYEKYKIYDRSPQLIIEEFIIGQQYSIAAFVDHNGTPHFCEGIVSLKNAQDISVDDNYLYSRSLPTQLPKDVSAEMFRVAEAGVKALDMKSVPAHIELMYGPAGIKIIEIGARIGGYRPRMYSYSYGIDMVQQEVQLAIGKLPNLNGTFSTYCAVFELFPDREGSFIEISTTLSTNDFAYYRITAKKGDRIGPAKNGFKTAAIIIVTHRDIAAFNNLCARVDTMKVKVQP